MQLCKNAHMQKTLCHILYHKEDWDKYQQVSGGKCLIIRSVSLWGKCNHIWLLPLVYNVKVNCFVNYWLNQSHNQCWSTDDITKQLLTRTNSNIIVTQSWCQHTDTFTR